jgi:predicted nucleotidyltransferase
VISVASAAEFTDRCAMDASEPNVEYRDRGVALSNEILRSVVGSGVHGIAIAGTDDHDEMGVYVEPADFVVGVSSQRPDYVWRTQPEGVRSGPGDTDLILYSLHKYLRLAIKGNPTVLLPLYAPAADLVVLTPLGEELRAMRSSFLSQVAVERFLGYMDSQHERMLGGGKRNRVPSRPELVEKYGWDVKYGSHALRLAYQGREIATDGTLTLPLVDVQRQRVLMVKRGEVSRDEVSAEITAIKTQIRALLDEGRTAVRPEADLAAINSWAIDAQRRHWGWM